MVAFVAVAAIALPLSSCFVRKRVVVAPGNRPVGPILTATKEELIERVHRAADGLAAFSLRIEMSPSVGSVYVGEIKDYATLGGYILYRKPGDIRIVATDPVLGRTIFDMVSAGEFFRVSVPSQDRFLVGRNDAPPASEKQVENLRPSAFLNSLLIRAPEPDDITLLEEESNDHDQDYELLMVRHEGEQFRLDRALYFDRRNLQIVRQTSFDGQGRLVSDTRYSDWKEYGGVPFPSTIDIKRPRDRYEVQMNVLAVKMNSDDVTADKFDLPQPPGTKLESITGP